MPIYAMLPMLTEYCVEQGWTLAYSRVGDVGIGRYVSHAGRSAVLPLLGQGGAAAAGRAEQQAAQVQASAAGPGHQNQPCLSSCPYSLSTLQQVLYFALYMTSVEFFVYWQHRILHMGAGYR